MRVPLLLAAVALTACSAGADGRPAIEMADTRGNVGTWGFKAYAGDVLVVGMEALRVHEPATLESVELEMASGEVELLTARVAPHAGGGSFCGRQWPPAGYGTSAELPGYAVNPGDTPALILYVSKRSDHARTRAVVLRYRDDDGSRRTLRITNEGLAVEPPTEPADARNRCHGDHAWLRQPKNTSASA